MGIEHVRVLEHVAPCTYRFRRFNPVKITDLPAPMYHMQQLNKCTATGRKSRTLSNAIIQIRMYSDGNDWPLLQRH